VALKVEAYIMSGITSIIRQAGIKQSSFFKGEVRSMINTGLRNILMHEREQPEDTIPDMAYARYEEFVCKWGVHLIGWTEDSMCNPGNFKSTARLKRLYEALKDGSCHWECLTEDEWKKRKDAL
ncbi:hypothetical protein NEOLEDRAFT_1050596, partial [Neolentinus lepideus HHB14362 ss-1]